MENNAIAVWSPEQINIIKQTIAPGLTDQELSLFAMICQKSKLDPFNKQIYAIKRAGRMTTMASIDGLRLVAERTGQYAPGEATEFLYEPEEVLRDEAGKFVSKKAGRLIGATVYVKKLTADGTWHKVSATALVSEYSTNQGLWSKMPSVMIEKVAESRALRKAFPQDTAGLYEASEMDQAVEKVVAAPKRQLITDEQFFELISMTDGFDGLQQEVLKMAKLEKLQDLAADRFAKCKAYITDRIKQIASESVVEVEHE